MKIVLIASALIGHIVAPLAFCVWLAFGRARNRLNWLVLAAMTAAFLMQLHLAGPAWHWIGAWWIYLWWAFFAFAVFLFFSRRWKMLPFAPPARPGPWASIALMAAIGAFFAMPIPGALDARNYPGEAVSLRFPLSGGAYHIGHGGAHSATNAHHNVRAQRYALDIVAVNPRGFRASGLLPENLSAYVIFGRSVIAPCDGEIIAAFDGLDDLTPPNADRANPAGNHVAIFCKGVTILLAHLLRDSVAVEAGAHVKEGHFLGRVGNSGNTSEPHLHIHAVWGRETDFDRLGWEGEGVPMLFDGRFLARNDRYVAP